MKIIKRLGNKVINWKKRFVAYANRPMTQHQFDSMLAMHGISPREFHCKCKCHNRPRGDTGPR